MRGLAMGIFIVVPLQRDAMRRPTGQSLMTQVKVLSIPSFLIPRTVLSTREQAIEGLFIAAPLPRDATKQPTGQSLMTQVKLLSVPSFLIP